MQIKKARFKEPGETVECLRLRLFGGGGCRCRFEFLDALDARGLSFSRTKIVELGSPHAALPHSSPGTQ